MDSVKKIIIIIAGAVVLSILVAAVIVAAPKNSYNDITPFLSKDTFTINQPTSNSKDFSIDELKSDDSMYLSRAAFEEKASQSDGSHIRLTSGVSYVNKFDTQLPYICITFDDCPSGDMEGIFNVLEKYNMRATFFVNGIYILANPGYLDDIIKRGHTIGNHTFGHLDTTQISTEKYRYQITSLDDMVYEETGFDITLYRPPFGKLEWDYILTDYTVVMWDIESKDSFYGSTITVENAISGEYGSIILFHSASIEPSALEEVCKYYYDRGILSIPVEEMLAINQVEKNGLQILDEMEYYIR